MWEVWEVDLGIVIEWMWNLIILFFLVFVIFVDYFKWKMFENCVKDVKNVLEIY